MEVYLLDEEFERKEIIDEYKSFIWTERFNKCGDFELYISADSCFSYAIQKDNFFQIDMSDDLMIVEKIESDRNNTEGHYLIITGENLVSLLKRRIIWGFKYLNYDTQKNGKTGGLEAAVKELLNDCIISPKDPNRKIPNFIYRDSGDERIRNIQLSVQYDGENLYDAIYNLCTEYKVGFKVFFEDGNIVFTLFMPMDRSVDTDSEDTVIFSPFYDNLADIKYTDDDTDLKTISLVKYDEDSSSSSDDDVPEEPEDRICITVGDAKLKGISRRELFFDADNISTTIEKNGEEVELEDDEFKEHLKKKGLLNLNKYATKSTVDGEIMDNKMYEYKTDYDLGDIVLLDDCIHQGQKRVSEMIYSQDSEGQKMYPSFEDLEDDDDEED